MSLEEIIKEVEALKPGESVTLDVSKVYELSDLLDQVRGRFNTDIDTLTWTARFERP